MNRYEKKRRTIAISSEIEKCHGNRESFQLQIKNHRNDNSFQSLCQKVGEKTSGQRSGQHESTASSEEKKEQQRGGTKVDKSLRGTTTGTCDTSDQNETSIKTNSRQRTISMVGNEANKNVHDTYPATKKTSDDERKKRKKNQKSNKKNHTTSTTTRVTTAASK